MTLTPSTRQPLAGRSALVTGGSAGIGEAVCEALLAQGVDVTAVGLEAPALGHPRLASFVVDLSVPEETAALASEIAHAGRFDILVNNAGVVRNTLLGDVDEAEYALMMNLHVRSAILLAQACLPHMKAQGFGRIVNVASRAIVGLAGRTVYGASKAALVAMTRTWAMELGQFGITVNAVSPGPTVTPMLTRDIPEGSERAAALAASLPVRRLGRPDDVARAVMFFADPANDWITGQNLFVCGGGSLGASLAL